MTKKAYLMCLKTKILILFACKEEDVDVDRDIDGCCIVELVWYVSQLMYIHHKNYVFQKRWSKNRYPTYMNMYDTLSRIDLPFPLFQERADKIPVCIFGDCEIDYHLSMVD
ncbi:hypothetical protein BDB01DRAFT_838828 [Pilobolus umbonatus]|nr:hypothetical protein BDB01DRAFT_838828 [Pilobolus umbonatus]